MRRLIWAAAILAAIGVAWGCGDGDVNESPTGANGEGTSLAAAVADSALEAAVRLALQKPGGELTAADLLSLTQLEAQDRGISDLTGIGKLRNLSVLDLSSNEIGDMSPVSALSRLVLLDLTGNQIEDITAVGALVHLEALLMAGNRIQDIAPLLQLEYLNSLELDGNPLSAASIEQAVPLLQGRGIEVAFHPDSGGGSRGYRDYEIAYVGKKSPSSRRTDIYVRNTDGSAGINLTSDTALYSELTWSPDGFRIAFLWRFRSALQDLRYSEIYVMGSDGTSPTDVTQTAQNYTFHSPPAWSPDGTRTAFTRYAVSAGSFSTVESDVYVMDPDGSGILNLSGSGRVGSSRPVWSPDGEEIAFLRPDLGAQTGSYSTDIHVVGSGGSAATNLTSDSAASFGELAWSPGRRIAAVAYPADPHGVPQLVVVDRDSQRIVRLTDFSAHGHLSGPGWSPDGERISIIYDSDIWIVDGEGGNLFNLTNHDPSLSGSAYAWRPR